jgi:hypothetical protein
MKTLVSAINKLIKKVGTETADNILAGMMLVHKDYFKLMDEIERYLKDK